MTLAKHSYGTRDATCPFEPPLSTFSAGLHRRMLAPSYSGGSWGRGNSAAAGESEEEAVRPSAIRGECA